MHYTSMPLISGVWGPVQSEGPPIDVHLEMLRRKLGSSELIETVRESRAT